MFDQSSRYFGFDSDEEVRTLTLDDDEQKEVRYLKRRMIPSSNNNNFKEYQIKGNDRLDLISYQEFRDPLQFWKICDVNNAMHPLELTRESGSTIKIPMMIGFEL